MNQILILFMVALVGGANAYKTGTTAETVKLTIDYKVLNTVEGYSYESKLDVYVDGEKIGSSSVKDQQVPNSVTVPVAKGNHEIKAVLLANYKGEWQERTIANDYSQDFVWVKRMGVEKNTKVKLYFDIDNGISEGKAPKAKKKK